MMRISARWLIIGAFLAIIILIADVTVTYRNTNELYQTGVMVAHTHDVLIALEDVLSLATDAETGQRGYIITGEESYLEPYNAAVDSINSKTEEIAALTADNPRQQERIPVLRSRIADKLDELNRTITIRRTSGAEAARTVVLSGQGKGEMDAIRSIVGEMTAEETNLRNERLAARDHAYRAAISEGLFSGILAIAAIVAFLLLLRRHYNERERSTFIIAEQSERIRTTLASIGDGVIATDTDGNVTVMNAVAEELTGWVFQDAVGRPLTEIFKIVNETTREPVDNPVMRALSEGVIVGLANHTILIARDGTERPIDDSAAPIRCAEGEIVGCVLVFRDISERHHAEAARARLSAIVESSNDAIVGKDLRGIVTSWNAGAEEIFGYTASEMIGQPVLRLIPAERQNEEVEILAKIGAGETIRSFETERVRKDGTIIQISATISPIKDASGKIIGGSKIARDITAAKRAEEELGRISAEAEQQRRVYDTVLKNTPDLAYVFDLNHRFTFANHALLTMWGKTMEESVGKNCLELGYEPWHAEMHDREIDQVVATKRPIRGEVSFTGTNGKRMYDYIFVPVIGENGEVVAVAGTTRDVTDQKAAEAEIRALSEYNRNVLESISDPLFTLDRDWRFTYMSSGGEELVMKKPGELDGKVIWDEFPGLIGSPFEPLYREAMDGVAGRITDFYPDHNIWYEINLFPSPTGITVYFRNVTERIKREQNLGFLADLLKDFTPLSTADAIIKLAGARIAEYLKLSHCSFAEISEAANESVIIYDHHDTNSPDLAGSYPLDQFLDAETEIRQLSDGSVVSIDNVDEGRSQESTERFSALGIKSLVCAPYVTDGRWLFALAAFRAEPHKWGTDEIDLLRELAARVCLSIQRARAEEDLERARGELEVRVQERTAELAAANTELQAQAEERLRAQDERVRLLGQIISSQEDERHRIARDMHDDLGQRITALRLHLETLGEIGGDASSRKLLEIREIAKELDSDLSSIVWRLRPAALDNVGLKSALADYAAKWSASFGTAIEFRSSEFDDSALSLEVQTCLYRITQEALNNIHKYAEADSVNVILDRREQDITLIVEDNGKGFEPKENKEGRKGFGLVGMAERAGLCGGVVEIESAPGSGTTIFVRIPISH